MRTPSVSTDSGPIRRSSSTRWGLIPGIEPDWCSSFQPTQNDVGTRRSVSSVGVASQRDGGDGGIETTSIDNTATRDRKGRRSRRNAKRVMSLEYSEMNRSYQSSTGGLRWSRSSSGSDSSSSSDEEDDAGFGSRRKDDDVGGRGKEVRRVCRLLGPCATAEQCRSPTPHGLRSRSTRAGTELKELGEI